MLAPPPPTHVDGISAPMSSQVETEVDEFAFIDVEDHTKVKSKIDLDNVVLTDKEKLRLARQCVKTKEFWYLYVM